MRKEEQKFWDTMRSNIPPGSWIQRIENVAGAGMPDVMFCWKGHVCFIELKAVTCPKKLTTRLLGSDGLNPDQIAWHRKAAHHKLKSYIAVRDENGRLYLFHSALAEGVNDFPMHKCIEFVIPRGWAQFFEEVVL